MKQFSNSEKAVILEECDRTQNIAKVAEKYGITRTTIYNWKGKRGELKKKIAEKKVLDTARLKVGLDEKMLEGVEDYAGLLAEKGNLERRKQLLSSQVEYILWRVVRLLENHPDLNAISPKDLSKVMTDLHAVRKELSNEPTVIVEYRNEWMERVLQVLQEFLGDDELRAFASKMQSVEAEYEVL